MTAAAFPTLTSSIGNNLFLSLSYRHFRSLSPSGRWLLTRPFRLRYDNSRHMSLLRSGRRSLLQSQWNLCCGIARHAQCTYTHEHTRRFSLVGPFVFDVYHFSAGVFWDRFNQHWRIQWTHHERYHIFFNSQKNIDLLIMTISDCKCSNIDYDFYNTNFWYIVSDFIEIYRNWIFKLIKDFNDFMSIYDFINLNLLHRYI